jgi:hypothetical protein
MRLFTPRFYSRLCLIFSPCAFCLTACEVIALNGNELIALMEGDHGLGYAAMKQLSLLLTSELTGFAAG